MKKKHLAKLVLKRQNISLLTGMKIRGGGITNTCPKPPAVSDKCSDMVTCKTCITCVGNTCLDTCFCPPPTSNS